MTSPRRSRGKLITSVLRTASTSGRQESRLATVNKSQLYANLERIRGLLVAPRSGASLKLVRASETDLGAYHKVKHTGLETGNYGEGDGEFFLRTQDDELYPVIGDIPILLFPERLVKSDSVGVVDLKLPQYEEAYTEMDHYNTLADGSADVIPDILIRHILDGTAHSVFDLKNFPNPPDIWIDDVHNSISQHSGYQYLSPIEGKVFMQLGGSGTHAVKALIGGARMAVLLTPMVGEAHAAQKLATQLGVGDRLLPVIGVGEELPFPTENFDAIYSGGCLHHMRTDMAFAEMYRVLKSGGRFACVDPWKTLLHAIGTSILGRREANVFCRPIDHDRLEPINLFKKHQVSRHGPLFRYFFLGVEKLSGITLSPMAMMKITRIDDAIGRLTGRANPFGGSILMCGER